MKNIFFVDSENVGDAWIKLFDYLNEDDIILVFYSNKSPNMSYENLILLKHSPVEPEFILCENGTDNSLDFQLVTYLGSLTVKNPDDNLIIVSKDKGFDSVVHFWSERGFHVCRKAPSIFHTLSAEEPTTVSMSEILEPDSNFPESSNTERNDTTEVSENVTEHTTKEESNQISALTYIDEVQLDVLLSCIGNSNLSALHNMLKAIYGDTVGKEIYEMVKLPSYEIPTVNWQKKTKYRKFLNIIYSKNEVHLSDDFFKKLYPQKANLKEINKLFTGKYGQEKGTEYYKIYKTYADFLQKTF